MKRVLHAIPNVLKILLVVFSATVLIFTLLSSFGFNKQEGIFGFRMYIVLSDSMRGVFRVGDVAVSRDVEDKSVLQEGDIITFISTDPANYGAVITHKIKERTEHKGKPAFITYGTATGDEDITPVFEEYVIGKYMFAIPKVGYVFSHLKTPLGYVFIVLLPFVLLIGFEGANFIKIFKEYKSELQNESEQRVQDLESENIRLRQAMEEIAKQKESGDTSKNENSDEIEQKEQVQFEQIGQEEEQAQFEPKEEQEEKGEQEEPPNNVTEE